MKEIIREDACNDTYGRIRMYQALLLKQPEGVHIPSERTVYRVIETLHFGTASIPGRLRTGTDTDVPGCARKFFQTLL